MTNLYPALFFFGCLSILVFIFKRQTVQTNSNGISFKSILGNNFIAWDEVLSMSKHLNRTSLWVGPHYQLKTKQGTFNITPGLDINIIKKIIEHAHLELVENPPATHKWYTYQPRTIQRWQRKGQEYQYTSLEDRLEHVGYYGKHQEMVVIFAFVVVIILFTVGFYLIGVFDFLRY